MPFDFERNLVSSRESLDKQTLILSSSALVFSVHFLKSLPPFINANQWMILLVASWWGFGLSILCTIFSFASSEKHNTLAIDYNNLKIKQRTIEEYKRVLKWNNVTSILNIISLILLSASVMFFLTYATKIYLNQMPKNETNIEQKIYPTSNENLPKGNTIDKGYVSPSSSIPKPPSKPQPQGSNNNGT